MDRIFLSGLYEDTPSTFKVGSKRGKSIVHEIVDLIWTFYAQFSSNLVDSLMCAIRRFRFFLSLGLLILFNFCL